MQKLPASGPAREALREKGQFWTPQWLAKAMAAWVVAERPPVLFDPAVGPGTFFAAARDVGFKGDFAGFEVDDSTLSESYKLGLAPSQLREIVVGDFIGSRTISTFPAIISNPPYIRHHRLGEDRKKELRLLANKCLGFTLDGRVGLHVYFLLKCLEHLAPGGRLAFLLPADVCEGVSSAAVWKRLSEKFRIEAVLTFSENAAPFPSVDTNALVFLLSHRPPTKRVAWLRILQANTDAILSALQGEKTNLNGNPSVIVHSRCLDELLGTGLSRPPHSRSTSSMPLSAFAKVVRGIATGANQFFFLTAEQIRQHGLDDHFFKRAIGRTRDCPGDILRREDLETLDSTRRPTWLLNLGKQSKEELPAELRHYLRKGEQMGLPSRPLIATRKPWYRMETRAAPALLFAYLGRRDCRFILNRAGALPLTGFLCVYPWDTTEDHIHQLWHALNHPDTIANLVFIAKSYGSGALKVEPRQLDTLEIPKAVMDEFGLVPMPSWGQTQLLDEPKEKPVAHVNANLKKPVRTNQRLPSPLSLKRHSP
jgi:hypothetical protein